MPTNVINKIKLPNADVYDIQDANALPKTTTINGVSKAQDANTYTLTGDDIKLSGSYVVPQTYTPPVAGVTSVEDSIANLVKHVDDVVSGGVTSVDEAPASHLNITTTDGAVTVDVAQGYVIPPSTVQTPVSGGSTVSLVSTGDMDTWNNKQSSIKVGSSAVADANHVTTFAEGANVDITAENGTITIAATDTTYSTFDATHAGLAPAGGTTAGFLKNDGTWATPQDTTYTGTGAIDVNNTTHVISVADGNTTTKGVVQIKNSVGAASSASESLVVTEKAVASAIEALPEPMVFMGSVGDSGTVTWTNLPSASASNEGYTYKVITKHTTAPKCEVGDTIISNGSEWVVIPSGDEPKGDVTGIKLGTGGSTYSPGSDGVVELPAYPTSMNIDNISGIAANTSIKGVNAVNNRVDTLSTSAASSTAPSGDYVNQFSYDSTNAKLTINYLTYTKAASVTTTQVNNVVTKTS